MSSIYEPDEDSFLLSNCLKKEIKNTNLNILDMGAGSGIQSRTLIELGIPQKNLTLVDLNPDAIKYLRKNFPSSKIIKSTLFENVKGKFDLIIFNPPYLPEEKLEPKESKISTTGGKFGSEIINSFLKQSHKFLKTSGELFLLTSSLTKRINWSDYQRKLLSKKKLFFEELYVYKLWKSKTTDKID